MLSEELQIKIRGTKQTNREFAKSAGIKKKDLDSILSGVSPNNYILGKICKELGWNYEPGQVKTAQIPSRKIVHANFKEKRQESPLRAKGRLCIRCWFNSQGREHVYDTVEMAHPTSFRQHAFGKCRGQKASHILRIPLCKPCHKRFDEPKVRKSIELSEEFLFLIALFISQEFEAGNIIIKK